MSAADDGGPSSQQVDQLLGSSKLALALESDRYKHLLDHAPVAVAVSRGSGAGQHVVYINKAFENLMSMAFSARMARPSPWARRSGTARILSACPAPPARSIVSSSCRPMPR